METTSSIFLNKREEVRAGWRFVLYVTLTVVCGLGVVWLYSAALRVRGLAGAGNGNSVLLYASLCATTIFTAYLMLRYLDKRPLAVLGFAFHDRIRVEIGQGCCLSFALVSVVFLVEWSAGCVVVSWAGLSASSLLLLSARYVVLFSLAGAFEELALRGYAFQTLVQGTGKTGAVCLSSLFFGLGHIGNPHASLFGVVNTMLAGVVLSSAYLKTRSLWLPVSLHMTWNLTMGFLYGFPVSGLALPNSLLRLSQRGAVWVTGGAYGPEAGAITTVLLVLATAYIWISNSVCPAAGAAALWYERHGSTEMP